jgi:hypothetical protein
MNSTVSNPPASPVLAPQEEERKDELSWKSIGVMCELKGDPRQDRVWMLTPCLATGGRHDDTGLRGVVPDAVCHD